MVDRKLLRLSAIVLFAGVLLSFVAGFFHPGKEPPNSHQVIFAEYVASSAWTPIHFGQFVGMVVLIAGLIVLFLALDVPPGGADIAGRLGAIAAAVALALYGVLQAVDGVALKQAVDAWAQAPEAERAARFAAAEVVRWLEWGVRSYHSYVLGLALILFAVAVVRTTRLPRPVGYLMALSGVAYIAQGWVLGVQGFSEANSLPTLLGIITVVVWSAWLLVSAWSREDAVVVERH